MRRLPQLRPTTETHDEFEKEYLELQDLRSPTKQMPQSQSKVTRENQYEIQLRQQIQEIANERDFTTYLVRKNDFENEILNSREQPDAIKLYVGIAGQILKLLDPYDSGAVSALRKIIDYLVSDARIDPLELQNARKNNQILQQNLMQLSKTLEEKDHIIKEKIEEAKELSSKLQKANNLIQNLEINIVSLNGQIEKQLKVIKNQNEQLDELSKKTLEQQKILADMVKQNNDLLNDNMKGKQLLEENHLFQKQLQNQMKQIQQDAKEKLKDAERQAAAAAQLREEADRVQGTSKDEVERLKKLLKQQEQDFSVLNDKLQASQDALSKARQRIQQQNAQMTQQSADLNATKKQLSEIQEKRARESELDKRSKAAKDAESNAKKAKEAADEIAKLKQQLKQFQDESNGKGKKGKGKSGFDDDDDLDGSGRLKSSKGGKTGRQTPGGGSLNGSRTGKNGKIIYQKETYDHGAAAWLYENMPENDKVVYVNTAGQLNYTICKQCNKLINENSSGVHGESLELSDSDGDDVGKNKGKKSPSIQDQLRNVSAESLKLSTQAQALMNKINAHIDFFKNNNIDMTDDDIKNIEKMQAQLNDLTFKLTTIDLERSRLLKQIPNNLMKRMNMISSIGSQVLQLDNDLQVMSIKSSTQLFDDNKTISNANRQNSILQSKHMGSYKLHDQKALNSVTNGVIARELDKQAKSFVKQINVNSSEPLSMSQTNVLDSSSMLRSMPTNLEELKQEDLIGIINSQQQKYEEELQNSQYLKEFLSTEIREGDVKIEFQNLNKQLIDTVENMRARAGKLNKNNVETSMKLNRQNTETSLHVTNDFFIPQNSITSQQNNKIRTQPYTNFEQRVNEFLINTIHHITQRDPKFTKKRSLMRLLLKQYGHELFSDQEVLQLEQLLESQGDTGKNSTQMDQFSFINGEYKSPLFSSEKVTQSSQPLTTFDLDNLRNKLTQLEKLQKINVKPISERDRIISQLADLDLSKKVENKITPTYSVIIHPQNDEECENMHLKQIILTHTYPAKQIIENKYLEKTVGEQIPPLLDDLFNYQHVMQISIFQDQIFKSTTIIRYLSAGLFRKDVINHFVSNGLKLTRNGSAEFLELQTTIREKQFALDHANEIIALFKQQILNNFDKPMQVQEMLISYYQIKYGTVYLKYYFQTICNIINYKNSDLIIHICYMLVFNMFYNRYLQYFTIFMLNNIEMDLTYEQSIDLFEKTMILNQSQIKDLKQEFKRITVSNKLPRYYLIIKAYNMFISKINDLENFIYDAYSSQNSNNSNELLLEVNPLYRENIDTLTTIRSLTYVLTYEQFCCFNKRIQFFCNLQSKKSIMDTLQYLYDVLYKEEQYIDRQKNVLDDKKQRIFQDLVEKIHKVSEMAQTLINNKLHQMGYIIIIQFTMLILQANTMLYIDRLQAK